MEKVEWRALPEPTEAPGDLPYATHEGELELGEACLRCYTLSNGQRIINAEDLESFLEGNF